jgi:hypothetical protein
VSDSKRASGGGITFLGALTILFIGLKLTDNIDWSWWWVLAPTWMPIALLLTIIAVVLVVAGLLTGVEALGNKKRKRK